MAKLRFTISSANVLLGLVRARVDRLGSRVDRVGNRGIGSNVLCKLLRNECLVRDVWGIGSERPHRNCPKLSKDCSQST